RLRTAVVAVIAALCFQSLTPCHAAAQTSDSEKPVPILSGSAGYFNFVTAGQNQIDAQINPVLLLPLGDRWLVEGRMECEGAFQRPDGGGPYGGQVSKNLDYLEADYIANPHLTVTLGRFHALRHLQRAAVSHLDPQPAAGSPDFAAVRRIE
ncbi:MAG: hypothetical protein ABR921_21775, partial [Candidatus Sulfotelmatobacter sp.]